MDIYKECDLVIGSRIHGIGLATSLCIPSIPIGYDSRRGTFNGFYPYEYEECFEDNAINIVTFFKKSSIFVPQSFLILVYLRKITKAIKI